MSTKVYTVVDFGEEEDGGVEVVPTSWLINCNWEIREGMCYWPPFWKNVKLFKKAVMKRFAPDTEDWLLHKVSLVARADDYVKGQHKASLLEDGKIVETETEDDSKRHRYAAFKFACESDEDAQRAGGSKRHKKITDKMQKKSKKLPSPVKIGTTDVQEADYRPPKRQKSLLHDFQCVEADLHTDFDFDPNCHSLTSTPTHSIDAIATCATPGNTCVGSLIARAATPPAGPAATTPLSSSSIHRTPTTTSNGYKDLIIGRAATPPAGPAATTLLSSPLGSNPRTPTTTRSVDDVSTHGLVLQVLKVVTSLEVENKALRKEVEELRRDIKTLDGRLLAGSEPTEVRQASAALPALPVSTWDALKELDNQLKGSNAALAKKLQCYAVDDLAKSVQAMLGVIMTNTLALTITWTGNSHGATIYNRAKKNRFLELESLIQTLLDALIATRFKKAALCDVRKATQNWLSNAPDRIDPTTGTGGKKERMERTRKRKEQMFSEDAIEHDSSNSVLA